MESLSELVRRENHGPGVRTQSMLLVEISESGESRLWDSNPRPALYESAALPAELSRPTNSDGLTRPGLPMTAGTSGTVTIPS